MSTRTTDPMQPRTTTQTTTFCFFRFRGLGPKLWGFSQMQFARGPLNRTPGVTFCKMMGSGSGASFDMKPDLGVYSVMMIWPSYEAARAGIAESPVLAAYRAHAAEHAAVYLETIHARGLWDGRQPFEVPPGPKTNPAPIGILTRATLKKSNARPFWRSVPPISQALVRDGRALFAIGLGEVPWLQQVTFSIWRSASEMHDFAYANGPHRAAIEAVKEGDWFKEDLFARFRILEWSGTWNGIDPLAAFRASSAGESGHDAPTPVPLSARQSEVIG